MSLKTVPTLKKYGLQKKTTTTNKIIKTNKPSFFNIEEELEDDDENENEKEKEKEENKRKNNKIITISSLSTYSSSFSNSNSNSNNINEDDLNIFDYDGQYDNFKKKENDKLIKITNLLGQNEPPKSRYISKLQATAAVREKEKDRIYERILLKERQQEDAEFGDKPKFITSEYKKKLIEDQKWEIEDKIQDEIEKRTSATTRGMHGFYSNLLTKNIAMGGDVETSAISAYTAGSKRQQFKFGEEKENEDVSEKIQERHDNDDHNHNDNDKNETNNHKRKNESTSHRNNNIHADIDVNINNHEDNNNNSSNSKDHDEKRIKLELVSETPKTIDKQPQQSQIKNETITKSKDEVILSAKERYLQRKLQQQQQQQQQQE